MPSVDDFKDDKAVAQTTMGSSHNANGPLRTSYSASDEPRESLVTYSLSDTMQGMALYKPPGITYDIYNRDLSTELQDMGVEARWQVRNEKLTPYDVFVKDPDPATLGDLNVGGIGGANNSPPAAGGPPSALTGPADSFVCGDSVTVGTEAPLKAIANGWNFTVDAHTSRSPDSDNSAGGPSGLTQLKARNGNFGTVLIVNLGTNPAHGAPSDWIGQIMSMVTPSTQRVCWVTCNNCRGYIPAVNAEIHNLKNRDPRVVVADWDAMISGNRALINPGDGVHPTPEGYKALAKLIIDTIGPPPGK